MAIYKRSKQVDRLDPPLLTMVMEFLKKGIINYPNILDFDEKFEDLLQIQADLDKRKSKLKVAINDGDAQSTAKLLIASSTEELVLCVLQDSVVVTRS